MVTIRLYFDEDSMDRMVLRALRERNLDLLAANEVGMLNQLDQTHLDYATANDRVLCSFNRGDFMRIHTSYLRQGKEHAGIILAPQQRYSVGEYMRRLLLLMEARSAEEMRNRVEFLSNWN